MIDLKKSGGFTLLEVLIVLVILAVLAGLAVPAYISSIEKQRKQEAINSLGAIRSSENRYWGLGNTYSSTPTDLDFAFNIVPPGSRMHFTYSLVSAGDTVFVAQAIRTGTDFSATSGAGAGYTVQINQAGLLTANF